VYSESCEFSYKILKVQFKQNKYFLAVAFMIDIVHE